VAGLLRYGAAGRPVAFGVVGGLTVLARPDMLIMTAGADTRAGPWQVVGLAAGTGALAHYR
jgi:hypothetical protein